MIPPERCRTYTDANWQRREGGFLKRKGKWKCVWESSASCTQALPEKQCWAQGMAFPRKVLERGTSWHCLQCPFLWNWFFVLFMGCKWLCTFLNIFLLPFSDIQHYALFSDTYQTREICFPSHFSRGFLFNQSFPVFSFNTSGLLSELCSVRVNESENVLLVTHWLFRVGLGFFSPPLGLKREI